MIAREDNSGSPRIRRLRVDDHVAARPAAGPRELAGYSGQRLVLGAAVVFLVIVGVLASFFREWRPRHRARADFGATQVAPAVDPMAQVVPNGVDPAAWRQAVDDTHKALVAVTASDFLDQTQMSALRNDISMRVARARPETARAELTRLWDDLTASAGPVLTEERHPRPKLLRREPAKKSK